MKPTDKGYPITPNHIDAKAHFWNAFGHAETEISAGWIVRFCQQRGDWSSFTYKEIDGYYRKRGHNDGFTFNRLTIGGREGGPNVTFIGGQALLGHTPSKPRLHGEPSGGFITKDGELYVVSHEFVTACFKASPKEKSAKKKQAAT